MKTPFKPIAFLFLLTFLLSCKDNSTEVDEPQPNGTGSLNEYGNAVLQVEQITSELESLARGLWEYGNTYQDCATVESKNEHDDLIITLTYNASTPCSDGKTRSGKIIIRKKTHITTLEATVYLDNYYENGKKIEGMYGFLQLNVPGKTFALHTIVAAGKILSPNGHFVNFNASRKSYWKEGQTTTNNFTDDVVELYEAEYGLTLKDKGLFLADVKQPVILKKSCQGTTSLQPVKGTIFIRNTEKDISLNFGNGTCAAAPYQE